MRETEYFDMLCNTGDGVYIVDANKHIVRWNKGAERILKYAESDVLNQKATMNGIEIQSLIASTANLGAPLHTQVRVREGWLRYLQGQRRKSADI